jgi:hypothetical protein
MNKKSAPVIEIRYGYTGKDHLLDEIAYYAREQLQPLYSSKSAAKRAADRAIIRVCKSDPLYRGCSTGFIVGSR